MTRDQRLFYFALKREGLLETLAVTVLLGISPGARQRQTQYVQVKNLFSAALSDPDTVYHVNTKSSWTAKGKPVVTWIILGLLVAGAIFEWKSYTAPAMNDWASTVLHRCGL